MKMSKVRSLQNGRVRWQSRANTGEVDLVGDQFSESFFDEIIDNFYRVKEALSKEQKPPDGMTYPILDISHYSIFLPRHLRSQARVGYIDKLWRDGRALFAQGYFDETRPGQLAAKSVMEKQPEERRVSIVVYPDYSLVEFDNEGHRIFKGGNGKAWLDSIAITTIPADPGTTLEVKMDTIREDARRILGEEGEDLVKEWEELRQGTAKSLQNGALVKTEETDTETEDEEKAVEKVEENAGEPQASESAEKSQAAPLTRSDVLAILLEDALPHIGEAVETRIAPLLEAIGNLQATVKALTEDDVKKVKTAIENPDDWYAKMFSKSVQRSAHTGAAVTGEQPRDVFSTLFGGEK